MPSTGPNNECTAEKDLNYVKTPAGNGCATSCDGIEFTASFDKPKGVVINSEEDALFITDFGGNAIRRMIISSGVVTTIVKGNSY